MIVEPIQEGNCAYALIQIIDITGHFNRVSKLKDLIKNLEVEYDEIKEAERINRQLAFLDPLTGLANRLLLMDRLSWAIDYSQRYNEMLAVMFLDLDGFKEVNDKYGHETGDVLLHSTAQRLKLYVRKTDTVARIGGDEFVIVLTQVKTVQDIESIAEKITRGFDKPFQLNDFQVYLSVSIGISICPEDGTEPKNLIKKADEAMYRVKKAGKSNYEFY